MRDEEGAADLRGHSHARLIGTSPSTSGADLAANCHLRTANVGGGISRFYRLIRQVESWTDMG